MAEQTLYTLAHTDVGGAPFNNHGRTLRVVERCNSRASAVSLLFSNICGTEPLPVGAASIGLCDAKGTLLPHAHVPVTVNGVMDFVLAPGEEVWSDRANLALQPGDYFAVNLYYPTDTPVTSGNWLGNKSRRSKAGNFSADAELDGPQIASRLARTVLVTDLTTPITTLRRVVAHTDTPARVAACFGDSITAQCAWMEPLKKRLYHRYPGEITLCNLGISGNRLLHSSPAGQAWGEAGIGRFARDLLDMEGLTHAVIELGTNDLGQPGTHGIPDTEVPSLQQYEQTMAGLAARLHEKGVKVFAATMCPRVITEPYLYEREALRLVMNDWLRTADCFDGVIDLDAFTRRDDGNPGMRDRYVLPDGLHPTRYGGLCIAKAIDLELFA